MGIKEFTAVPRDIREWGMFFRGTTVTADVVAPNTVDTAMIVDDAVTDAKLRNSAELSVIGRSVNSPGSPADIAAANDGEVLRRSGASIGFGSLVSTSVSDFVEAAQDAVGAALTDTATIDLGYNDAGPAITASIIADSVSNTLLANMADSTIKGRTSGAGTGDPVDLTAAQVATIVSAAVASALNITSGTYTPTLTNVTNVSASSTSAFQYARIGSVVIVSGRINVTPTAATTATELGVSLPIASALSANEQVAGSAVAVAVISECAAVRADPTNDRARLSWIATVNTDHAISVIFLYQVL